MNFNKYNKCKSCSILWISILIFLIIIQTTIYPILITIDKKSQKYMIYPTNINAFIGVPINSRNSSSLRYSQINIPTIIFSDTSHLPDIKIPPCLTLINYKNGISGDLCVLRTVNSDISIFYVCQYDANTNNITNCEYIYNGYISPFFNIDNYVCINNTILLRASQTDKNVYVFIEQNNNITNVYQTYKYFATDLDLFDDPLISSFNVGHIFAKNEFYYVSITNRSSEYVLYKQFLCNNNDILSINTHMYTFNKSYSNCTHVVNNKIIDQIIITDPLNDQSLIQICSDTYKYNPSNTIIILSSVLPIFSLLLILGIAILIKYNKKYNDELVEHY